MPDPQDIRQVVSDREYEDYLREEQQKIEYRARRKQAGWILECPDCSHQFFGLLNDIFVSAHEHQLTHKL